MKRYSAEMLRAAEAVVHDYEQAILDLETGFKTEEEVAHDWDEYGTFSRCRLCRAIGVLYLPRTDGTWKICHQWCVLGGGDGSPPCCYPGSGHKNLYDQIMAALAGRENGLLLPALKARLSWILKRCEENDVVFEGVE